MAEALKVQKELWYREIDNIFKAMELKKGKRIQTVRITKKKKTWNWNHTKNVWNYKDYLWS